MKLTQFHADCPKLSRPLVDIMLVQHTSEAYVDLTVRFNNYGQRVLLLFVCLFLFCFVFETLYFMQVNLFALIIANIVLNRMSIIGKVNN